MLEFFAITAGGLLVWASWRLYSIALQSKEGKTFCGRKANEDIEISVDSITKKEKDGGEKC